MNELFTALLAVLPELGGLVVFGAVCVLSAYIVERVKHRKPRPRYRRSSR